jgi:peroxiredoxin
VELQSQLKEIQAQGLGLAAISYDSVEIISAFSKQRGITFPMLSDAGSATIKRYGILNPVVEQALGPNRDDPAVKAEVEKYVSVVGARPEMAGIAFPGTFVVDRRGRVTSRFFEDFYIDRNTVSNLLIKLGGKASAPVAATKVSTRHLDLTTYPSEAVVAPGNRFSLVLELVPHAKLHVYAPGAEKSGYRVISFKLDPHPQIRVSPVVYPASEIYYFKPLNEHVPVFQKPFRLVQELLLDGTPASQEALRGKQELTLTGTLEYQACDDRICYNPVSVPLSWKLSLRSLIRERPTVTP